jgi:hypothetical protein
VDKRTPLRPPKDFIEGGIFELKRKAAAHIGSKCLVCKDPLTSTRGRKPILCGRIACFRTYRNAYRKTYDRVRGRTQAA